MVHRRYAESGTDKICPKRKRLQRAVESDRIKVYVTGVAWGGPLGGQGCGKNRSEIC